MYRFLRWQEVLKHTQTEHEAKCSLQLYECVWSPTPLCADFRTCVPSSFTIVSSDDTTRAPVTGRTHTAFCKNVRNIPIPAFPSQLRHRVTRRPPSLGLDFLIHKILSCFPGDLRGRLGFEKQQ